MREFARISQGYFPTQDSIVQAVDNLFKLPNSQTNPLIILDAGCGAGQAIQNLREYWLTKRPDLNTTLLGIESDKHRYEQAADFCCGRR